MGYLERRADAPLCQAVEVDLVVVVRRLPPLPEVVHVVLAVSLQYAVQPVLPSAEALQS